RIEQIRTVREIIAHHWEGTVERVEGDTFSATLRSLSDPDESEKQAELPKDALNEDDFEMLRPGAVFYWTIGYSISASGLCSRSSTLAFRRLPAWTKKDVERLKLKAKELFAAFGEERNDPRQAGG